MVEAGSHAAVVEAGSHAALPATGDSHGDKLRGASPVAGWVLDGVCVWGEVRMLCCACAQDSCTCCSLRCKPSDSAGQRA